MDSESLSSLNTFPTPPNTPRLSLPSVPWSSNTSLSSTSTLTSGSGDSEPVSSIASNFILPSPPSSRLESIPTPPNTPPQTPICHRKLPNFNKGRIQIPEVFSTHSLLFPHANNLQQVNFQLGNNQSHNINAVRTNYPIFKPLQGNFNYVNTQPRSRNNGVGSSGSENAHQQSYTNKPPQMNFNKPQQNNFYRPPNQLPPRPPRINNHAYNRPNTGNNQTITRSRINNRPQPRFNNANSQVNASVDVTNERRERNCCQCCFDCCTSCF